MPKFSLRLPSITLFCVLLAIVSVFSPINEASLALLFGICFIFGVRLAALLLDESSLVSLFGIGLIAGFSFIGIAIMIPYGFVSNLSIGLRNFILLSVTVMNVGVDLACLLKQQMNKTTIEYLADIIRHNFKEKCNQVSFAIFVFAFILRLGYQFENAASILPDGALYFSAGRTLAETGNFSVNLLNYVSLHSPLQYYAGLIPRTDTWLMLGSFFSFGGATFGTGKLVLVIFGSLLVFPVCDLARYWFKDKYWIAGLIVAVHPTLLFYSSVLFGPELLSTVFAVDAILVLELAKIQGMNYKAALLSAFMLGASLLAWEDKFVVLYLIAYFASLLTVPGFRKRTALIMVFVTFGFYLTLSLSVTWWMVFYPIYFAIILLLLGVVFRKVDTSFSAFLFMISAVTCVFSVWVNRFYLDTSLVINPTIQSPVRRTASFYLMSNVFQGDLTSLISTYYSLMIQSALVSILILGLLAFVVLPRKKLATGSFAIIFLAGHFLAMILFVPKSSGFDLIYSASRFFLGPLVFLTILASATIAHLLERITGTLTFSNLASRKSKVIASCLAAGLVFVALLPVMGDLYMNGYARNMQWMSNADYVQNLGVLGSAGWIKNNTISGQVFLVASTGTTSIWSMQFADRTFVSLNLVEDGQVLAYNKTTIFDVLTVATRNKADYLIFDPMIKNFGYVQLAEYYDRITPTDVGRNFFIIPQNSSMHDILSQPIVTSLEVVFVNSSPKVVILQPKHTAYSTLWSEDNFDDSWKVALNGTIEVENGLLTLSTPKLCPDMVYAKYAFNETLNFTENTLMVFRADTSASSMVGFYLFFSDGTDSYNIFPDSGLHVVNLGKFVDKVPNLILIYNTLKSQYKNTNVSYSVSYDFFLLLDS